MYRIIPSLILIAVIVTLSATRVQLFAQDPVLSQFYAAPLLMNPAFAGTTDAAKISMNYRNQWSSIFNAYQTYAVAYDQYFEKIRSGVGFSAMVDQAGDGIYNTGNFNMTYAYKLPISNNIFLKGGAQVGIYQTRLNWDKLVFLDQLDPIDGQTLITEELRPNQLSKNYLDVSAGLLIYSKMFYGGISLYHINTPDESILEINENLIDGLPMRLSLHAGTQISLSRNNKNKSTAFISPNVMFTKQNNFQQINLGAYVEIGALYGGTWFRHTFTNADAAIFLVGFTKDIFKIGYSYDMTVSSLNTESNGSHEISILINFDKGKRKPQDYNDCFKLFR